MINYSSQSNIIKSIFALLLISILFNACQQVPNTTNHSLHSNNQSLTILRFEQELFKSDSIPMDSNLKRLNTKYDAFFDVYFTQIMNFGNPNNKDFPYIVNDFVHNADFNMLLHDCDSVYNAEQLTVLTKEIERVFSKYQKVYPNDTLPKVCTFISGFNNAIVTTDGFIGIGLDLFLGAQYRFYPSLDLPEYLTRRYTPEHLLPMFVKGMAAYKYPFENDKPQLLDVMLNEGKMLYFMDQLIDEVEDSLKIGYSAAQLKWCQENEANIYQLLIQDGLYSSDFLKFRKYTDEAPFTVNLNNESAPRIAWYCGWQIIKKFMENNPSYTLDDLMKEKDSQKILNSSKYKP